MAVIAHVKVPYLPISETFIYEILRQQEKHQGIVLTDRSIENTDLFPWPHVYHLATIPDVPIFLRQAGVRLIHAHFGPGGIRILSAKQATGIPLLTSFHGVDASALPIKNQQYRQHLLDLFIDGELFTVVSEAMRTRLMHLGCPYYKIRVQHCGIDLNLFPYQPRKHPGNRLRILTVGRFAPKKGMKTLVKAFALVRQQCPAAELVMVGYGSHVIEVQKLVNELGLTDAIHLTGGLPHHQVRQLFNEAHLFCLASETDANGDQEGIPVVLMEAMAAGTPVVSTYHAGIPELISHGVSGRLAPEKNPQRLAGEILNMLSHPHDWPRITRAAREKVEQEFNISLQMERLNGIYAELLR